MHMLYKRLIGICFLFIPNIIIILFQFTITFVRQLLLFTNIMLDINRIKIRFLPSKPSRFPSLAGCTRHLDSHVDGHWELKFTFLKILRKKFNCVHHHGHLVPWLATKSIHRLQNSIFLIKF